MAVVLRGSPALTRAPLASALMGRDTLQVSRHQRQCRPCVRPTRYPAGILRGCTVLPPAPATSSELPGAPARGGAGVERPLGGLGAEQWQDSDSVIAGTLAVLLGWRPVGRGTGVIQATRDGDKDRGWVVSARQILDPGLPVSCPVLSPPIQHGPGGWLPRLWQSLRGGAHVCGAEGGPAGEDLVRPHRCLHGRASP